jgi:hypothetical protein
MPSVSLKLRKIHSEAESVKAARQGEPKAIQDAPSAIREAGVVPATPNTKSELFDFSSRSDGDLGRRTPLEAKFYSYLEGK